MKEEKDLISYNSKKSFFAKIKNFFKRIFSKEEKLKDSNTETNNKSNLKDNRADSEFLNSIKLDGNPEINKIEQENDQTDAESEKAEFFRYYNDYKNGKITEQDLPGHILLKVNMMLDEELEMKIKDYLDLEQTIMDDDV